MIRTHLRTVVTSSMAALLVLAALVPVATATGTPKLGLAVTQLVPGGVTAGSSQGFEITVTNEGTSKLRWVHVWTDLEDASTFVDEGDGWCTPAGKRLWCTLGSLHPGESETVSVAFAVPFSTGDGRITFKAGAGLSRHHDHDRHGWSDHHHDHDVTAESEQVVRILAPDSENLAAVFVTGTSYNVGNDQKVGRSNPQATRVVGEGQFIPVSVQDGAKITFACPASICTKTQLGQWSQVNVGDGQVFEQPFRVRLRIADRKVPDNLKPRKVVVYHVLDNGTVETISKACNGVVPSAGAPECRDVKVTRSGNLVINVFTYKNGGYKGAF